MNDTLRQRVIEAKKYQKKAFYALLPESAAGHIEVIEREFLLMMTECIMEFMNQNMDTHNETTSTSVNKATEKSKGKVRKVKIG